MLKTAAILFGVVYAIVAVLGFYVGNGIMPLRGHFAAGPDFRTE